MTDALSIYQPLLSSIYSFYTSRTLGKNVGVEPLKKFMALIIGLMVDQKLPNSEENEYTKVVNGICLKIFDKSNFTNIICALIRLLKETCSGSGLPKFTDLLMKCIWRNVKNLPEKSNELDYDAVLLEVHEFMVQLPSSYWHQRHTDTPYRTVKTIIHHLAQIKGNNILQHLQKIPTHSELYSYLLKVLKVSGLIPAFDSYSKLKLGLFSIFSGRIFKKIIQMHLVNVRRQLVRDRRRNEAHQVTKPFQQFSN